MNTYTGDIVGKNDGYIDLKVSKCNYYEKILTKYLHLGSLNSLVAD